MRACLLTLAIASLLALPVHAQDQEPPQAAAPAAQEEAPASAVPLAEISRYVLVFNAVRSGYVDPVDDRELMQSAIRGLLLDLDPHSAYLERSDAEAFDENTTGAYEGIGVEVMQLPDGSMRVVAPMDDTPAQRAGIRSGDVITAVDGVPLTPSSHDQRGPLRGPPGTEVGITLLREGEAEPLEITLRRETIRTASVRGSIREPGLGYLRVAVFQADTAASFADTLDRLHAEAGTQGLRGLVIDLRSNPGGLLTSAVQIADELLERGGIVSTRGRTAAGDTAFNATAGDRMRDRPVVVLMDAGSASASEVLAGALQDNARACVVGSRSFGKGSVQTVLPLSNGDAVKLTTARYYTPSGTSIQARGIEPDVVLQPEGGATRGGFVEALLPGHLAADDEGAAGSRAGDVLEGEAPVTSAFAILRAIVAGGTCAAPPQ
ncbi:S41 family peptidase [Luteimonas sp. MC1825]|uniref:S41 family peptidase n=1 Tax=Luteimonas sp. MC1825 TaxID=2761107 RepID=UPI0016092038|nr:S41 family peptidase [Luteimonas sp. MC1825]MBB6598191.1 S41 family peptidase [Luteimonas sp. MC1825]QOC88415.1 S41 family peptidase [Luteimonas sp. MC1825]